MEVVRNGKSRNEKPQKVLEENSIRISQKAVPHFIDPLLLKIQSLKNRSK